VVGCNTRRYHGLLVAATSPPTERLLALSLMLEDLRPASSPGDKGEHSFELGACEFPGAFAPRGFERLVEYRDDVCPTFVYRRGALELTKEISLAETGCAVAVRYTLRGGAAALALRPFVAMRDYHALRKSGEASRMAFAPAPGQGADGPAAVVVQDHAGPPHSLHMACRGGVFQPAPQWWHNFLYRQDVARGQDGQEDLYTPGAFVVPLKDGESCQFTASLDGPVSVDFEATVARRRATLEGLAASVGPSADETARRLAAATDSFVAIRQTPQTAASMLTAEPAGASGAWGAFPGQTILAGYHWFADWGRDAFIALPGILLATRRFDLARRVFATFARSISDGMVPNRFDEYGGTPHYNSIDASLWFVIAADRYIQATGDEDFWRRTLLPACDRILTAYHDGTLFEIRADADGLLTGGGPHTQLTWMDVALGQEAITPRHGKAVEVNALWHAAHRVMQRRCAARDGELARRYGLRADIIAPAFARTFWNDRDGWLFDCVSDGWPPDASLRPNQVIALALPDCPLTRPQQISVLRAVTENLLTPLGLRTLSPRDGRYRRRYGGSWESRDRAYHQGTVWPWLIGPYVDALLNVEGDTPATRRKARDALAAFDGHLREAGLGFVSEILDGDAPHAPRGCIAQAWSVGEVLRAKLRAGD
jgi:glycogen debranching enzyme